MIELHFHPGTASMAPHILLHELGLAHRLVRVDLPQGGHKTPDYLRLNPNGVVPVMVERDAAGAEQVLYEAAAICLHLADSHPEARLMPPLGSPERAQAYKWLIWETNTLQTMLMNYFRPERLLSAGDAAGAAQVQAAAEAQATALLGQIEAQLASHGQPWLLGERFSLVDIYTLMLGRWTRRFAQPARAFPLLGAHLQRMLARPSVVKAFEIEGIVAPLV
jgi:glutathione S-transferase